MILLIKFREPRRLDAGTQTSRPAFARCAEEGVRKRQQGTHLLIQ